MTHDEVTHLLVTNPRDVGYLTGFLGGDSYLLVRADATSRPVIVSDGRYEEELSEQSAWCDLVIRTTPMTKAVTALIEDMHVTRLGVQGETMTIAEKEAIERPLADTTTRLVTTKGLVAKLRVIKDDAEAALIRHAIKIQETALRSVLPEIKPGLTELEVSAMLESAMKGAGSPGPAFETIVAARAMGSLPHYRPTTLKLAKNQPLLIDWGATYRGYRGDMTRTFTLGAWPKKMREIYQIVLDAHRMAAAALAPGKRCKDIDAVARDHITRAGYGPQFAHSLGHGLGLDTHEPPRLSYMAADEDVLRPGMVVTIEPGVYIPGVGGVRIEDDYLVTPAGAENLCSLPKDIGWATL